MGMRIGIGLSCNRPAGGGTTDTSLYIALRDGTLVTDRTGTQITVREP